jgi:hypothetical protein
VIDQSAGAFQLVKNDGAAVVEAKLGDILKDVVTISQDAAMFDLTNVYDKNAQLEAKIIALDKLQVTWDTQRNTLIISDGETSYTYIRYTDNNSNPAGVWASTEYQVGVPYIWEAANYQSFESLDLESIQTYIQAVLPGMQELYNQTMAGKDDKFFLGGNDSWVESPFSSYTTSFASPLLSLEQIVDANGHTAYVMGFIITADQQQHPIFLSFELDGMLTYYQNMDQFHGDHIMSNYKKAGGFDAIKNMFINKNGGRILFDIFAWTKVPDIAFKADPQKAIVMKFLVNEKLYEIWNTDTNIPYGTANAIANIWDQLPLQTQNDAWNDISNMFLGVLDLGLQ